jgi:hypothetical protein
MEAFANNNYALLKFIVLTYISLTTWEWILHKYFMHAKKGNLFYTVEHSKAHLKHHAHVENDFRITKKNDTGLVFTWFPDSVITLVVSIISLSMVNEAVGTNFTRSKIIVISAIIAILYCALWNTLHIAFHKAPYNRSMTHTFPHVQIPDNIKKNPILSWLWRNHLYHHINKGQKGNFNIIVPGADFLFGTYRNKINNDEFCQSIAHKTPKEMDLCNNIPNVNNIAKNIGFNGDSY